MIVAGVEQIRKSYGTHAAVDGVSLQVRRGETVALLGANGAGKTTTLEILLGLRSADSGTIMMNAASVGVTPQQSGMPENLRVCEIVDFVAAQYGVPSPGVEILEPFGLQDLRRRQTGGLSGGELRRLSLALTFTGKPEFVVLDEPTTGLDIESRRQVWDFVREYAGAGGTVLLTTHHMEEAETLASRIVVMNAGRIVREGTPEQVRSTVSVRRMSYVGAPFDPSAFGIDAAVECSGSRVIVTTAQTDELVRALVSTGVAFSDLTVSAASLEDAVLSLAGAAR